MPGSIEIKNGKLYVDHFEIDNKEIVSYFSEIPEEERSSQFESMLLAGTVTFKSIGTTERIDYIEKCFNKFHKCFDDKIDATFGEDGRIVKDVFDSNKEGTPLYLLKKDIKDLMKEIRDKLEGKKIEYELKEKTTLKGYSFEDVCEQILDDIIRMQEGDELQRTTDENGLLERSKKGDFVITLGQKPDAKIALEIKDVGAMSLPEIHRTLTESIENRGAKYGIAVFRYVESLPNSVGWFKEFYGNHLICAIGTKQHEEVLAPEMLRVAFCWAKMKVLSGKETMEKIDITPILLEKIQKIQDSLKNFSNIRTQCTNLDKATEKIRSLADEIEEDIISQISDMEREMNKAMKKNQENI
jgi:hypothetical protein